MLLDWSISITIQLYINLIAMHQPCEYYIWNSIKFTHSHIIARKRKEASYQLVDQAPWHFHYLSQTFASIPTKSHYNNNNNNVKNLRSIAFYRVYFQHGPMCSWVCVCVCECVCVCLLLSPISNLSASWWNRNTYGRCKRNWFNGNIIPTSFTYFYSLQVGCICSLFSSNFVCFFCSISICSCFWYLALGSTNLSLNRIFSMQPFDLYTEYPNWTRNSWHISYKILKHFRIVFPIPWNYMTRRRKFLVVGQ